MNGPWVILSFIAVMSIVFLWKIMHDINPKDLHQEKGNPIVIGIFSFFQFLMLVFGVSAFATGAIFYSQTKYVSDRKLPGTLNVSLVIPLILVTFVLIYNFNLDFSVLYVPVIAQTLGAYFVPRHLAKVPISVIRICLATGLAIVAIKFFFIEFGIFQSGNLTEFSGGKLVVLAVGCFIIGALGSLGVGALAPITVLISAMGMSPTVAFPIAVCATACSVTITSIEFVKHGHYSKKATAYSALCGSLGVLCALYIIQQLDTSSINLLLAFAFSFFAILFLLKLKKPEAAPEFTPEAQIKKSIFEDHYALLCVGFLLLCLFLIIFIFISRFSVAYDVSMQKDFIFKKEKLRISIGEELEKDDLVNILNKTNFESQQSFIICGAGKILISQDMESIGEDFFAKGFEVFRDSVINNEEFHAKNERGYFSSIKLKSGEQFIISIVPAENIRTMVSSAIQKYFLSPILVIVYLSLAMCLLLVKIIRQGAKQKAIIEMLSVTDSLTKLYNRRAFNENLDKEFARMMREKRPLSFIILDIDDFKMCNDTYGHLAGDVVLKEVSNALRATVQRAGDMVVRLGGEEFGVLLPGLELASTTQLAEEIRKKIEALDINIDKGTLVKITISAGVASIAPSPRSTAEELLKQADNRLYEAKRSGKNCVR
ncbi:MAG: diguanylate cyclase [Fibromonadaceae bacterium]|jgi:diguanylate cyclase (GGDEF)-like protein|nr:diguanylate cyclase [Fibromonadaceae bacterium]